MGLYLFPGTSENIAQTVKQTVSYERLQKHIPLSYIMQIKQRMQGREPCCWAISKDCKIDYLNIYENDAVLFKENHKDEFTLIGYIADRYRSLPLGKELWGGIWEKILFIKEVRQVSIPKDRLRDALNYNDDYWFPGAIKIDDMRLYNAIGNHITYNNFINYLEHGTESLRIFITKRNKRVTKKDNSTLPLPFTEPATVSDDDSWKI